MASFKLTLLFATAFWACVSSNIIAFSNSNISINCQNDLNQWTQDIEDKKLYALQMVDAFGKPDSGLLYGSALWLGGYDECLDNKEHRLRSSIGII